MLKFNKLFNYFLPVKVLLIVILYYFPSCGFLLGSKKVSIVGFLLGSKTKGSQTGIQLGQEVPNTGIYLGQEVPNSGIQLGQEVPSTGIYLGQEVPFLGFLLGQEVHNFGFQLVQYFPNYGFCCANFIPKLGFYWDFKNPMLFFVAFSHFDKTWENPNKTPGKSQHSPIYFPNWDF